MMNNQTKKTLKKMMPETLKVLDMCQQIYTYAEDLYLYLASVHKEHREIARIWGLLAIDKCNHSDTFKMASRLKGDGISEICISVDAVAHILSRMKAIPKGDNRKHPSLIESLSFTVKMEENLNSVHFCNVVKFLNEQDTALMASSLKSSSSILHLLTEEYLNLTVLESETF
jgi:rubrerythrin